MMNSPLNLHYLRMHIFNIKFWSFRQIVNMSDPPGHFMLFCKLQKVGQTDAKRSQRDIESSIQIGGSGVERGKS